MNDNPALAASAGSAIYGIIVSIQQDNCSAMEAKTDGRYPACKPVLGGTVCMHCGRDVRGRFDACPSVQPEHRWDWKSPNAPASATGPVKGPNE
ncbi:MAG: hypothetical protein E6Q97_21300 [Desulfurellales bacterium]|nr:MAG: hypothetical protein E6Q97_21300 [Desulfurellales bacterium]